MDSEVLALLVRVKDEASEHFAKIEKSLGGVAAKADVAGRAMDGLHGVMGGLAAGLGIAAFQNLEAVIGRIVSAIPDLINRGKQFAETVDTIQNATGASAEASSRLAGQMAYVGVSTEGLALKMGVLAKGIIAHESELNKLGVSIRGANGHYLDGVAILERVRATLSGMTDGIKKTQLATELFGRSGADMIDWINLSDKQVGLLNSQLDALGVTMSQTAVDEAKAATREGNLLNLAMQGLANTLMTNVAPALTTAVDSIAAFVRDNGTAIATFASQVVNFVLGMIGALTDATVQTVTFTAEMAAAAGGARALGNQLDLASDKAAKNAAANAAATRALDKRSQAVQALIEKVKAQDTAEEKLFQDSMSRLASQLDAETALLDAKDRQAATDQRRADLAKAVAQAQGSLAGAGAQTPLDEARATRELESAQRALNAAQAAGDPTRIADAQQRLTELDLQRAQTAQGSADAQAAAQQSLADAQKAQSDYEASLVEQARRDQIASTKSKVEEIAKLEANTTDRVALAKDLALRETAVKADIAAATEKGDAQSVADLKIVLEAVTTAESRAQQAKRNADREADLAKQKAQLEELKAKISSVGAAYVDLVVPLKDLGDHSGIVLTDMKGHAEKYASTIFKPGDSSSLSGAMDAARKSGEEMGKSIKTALDSIGGAAKTVVDIMGGISGIINGIDKAKLGLGVIALGVVTGQPGIVLAGLVLAGISLAHGAPNAKPDAQQWLPAHDPGQGSSIIMPGLSYIPGRTDGAPPPVDGRRAEGGPVAAGGTYLVGERGPELLRMGAQGGTVIPNGAAGGNISLSVTVQGAALFDPYGTAAQQIAQSLLPGLRRELSRQGMSLS